MLPWVIFGGGDNSRVKPLTDTGSYDHWGVGYLYERPVRSWSLQANRVCVCVLVCPCACMCACLCVCVCLCVNVCVGELARPVFMLAGHQSIPGEFETLAAEEAA